MSSKAYSFPFYGHPGVLRNNSKLKRLLHVQEQKFTGPLRPLDEQRLQVRRFAAFAPAEERSPLRTGPYATDFSEIWGQDLRYARYPNLGENVSHEKLLEEHAHLGRSELEVSLADFSRLLIVVQAREGEDGLRRPLVFWVCCLNCHWRSTSFRREYVCRWA